MHLASLPEGNPNPAPIISVRTNDSYRLYGKLEPRRRWVFPFNDFSLSDAEDRKFLIDETFLPPLNKLGHAMAPSGNAQFDRAVEEKLAAPIWQRAYHLKGDIAVSGNRGFVYLNGRLFRPSVAEKRPPHNHLLKRLSMKARARSEDRLRLDRVLLVRHVFGHIYFHAYHDVMTKIVWADQLGLDPSIPIVVSAKWAAGHYGSHFIKTRLASGRQVIFQDWDQVLTCSELFWLRPPQFFRDHLDVVADSFDEDKPQDPPGSRIVLVRRKKTHDDRLCKGMDILSDHLVGEGFSVIDPADYTIPEQKWIFSRAEHIIGENGSAFTNILFRRDKPLRMDVIIGSGAATTTFQALSAAYGFDIHSHLVHSSKDGDTTHIELDRETAFRIARADTARADK